LKRENEAGKISVETAGKTKKQKKVGFNKERKTKSSVQKSARGKKCCEKRDG